MSALIMNFSFKNRVELFAPTEKEQQSLGTVSLKENNQKSVISSMLFSSLTPAVDSLCCISCCCFSITCQEWEQKEVTSSWFLINMTFNFVKWCLFFSNCSNLSVFPLFLILCCVFLPPNCLFPPNAVDNWRFLKASNQQHISVNLNPHISFPLPFHKQFPDAASIFFFSDKSSHVTQKCIFSAVKNVQNVCAV